MIEFVGEMPSRIEGAQKELETFSNVLDPNQPELSKVMKIADEIVKFQRADHCQYWLLYRMSLIENAKIIQVMRNLEELKNNITGRRYVIIAQYLNFAATYRKVMAEEIKAYLAEAEEYIVFDRILDIMSMNNNLERIEHQRDLRANVSCIRQVVFRLRLLPVLNEVVRLFDFYKVD